MILLLSFCPATDTFGRNTNIDKTNSYPRLHPDFYCSLFKRSIYVVVGQLIILYQRERIV
jgi:hypothetical protein